jgi:CheY-like chemotaxis protein
LIGEQIRFETSLDPNLHPINIHPAQIDQVIVNLVVNARDAMPDGGTLTLETANADSISKGPSVRLTVRDTGMGIDDTMLQHIFEPFYTTKAVGHGTGLGLAVVYGIVTQNGGRIRVQSRANQGSAFIIKFPSAAVKTVETMLAPAKVEQPAMDLASRGETILLVEDDDAVRRYLMHTLATHRYHVLEAHSPDEALQQAQRVGHEIQLLVTDMVMPGMNGQQLITRISEQNPSIKVLLISGYTDTIASPHDQAGHPVHFLEKPFKPNDFACMVRHILDEAMHPAHPDCIKSVSSS